MNQLILWDVDTQNDFIRPEGALYVDGAEDLILNFTAIIDYAKQFSLQVAGSVDYHQPSDAELSASPDFSETYPKHCLAGSWGAQKIPQTTPGNPLWIPSKQIPVDLLEQQLQDHEGEVYLRKQQFDLFSNPNASTVFSLLQPVHIILFGVTLDVCVKYAVEGFLEKDYRIILLSDATRAIDSKTGQQLLDSWQKQGVRLLKTPELLQQTPEQLATWFE